MCFTIIQLRQGADYSCLVARFLYKGTGDVQGVEEVSAGDQSPDGERSLTLGGGELSRATVGGDGSQGRSSQGSG